MRVTDDTVYVLTLEEDKQIFNSEDSAIEELSENTKDINDEGDNVSIVEVNIGEDNWEIAEVPWQKIAFKLL